MTLASAPQALVPLSPGRAAWDPDWTVFAEAYLHAQDTRHQSESCDQLAPRIAELVAGRLREHSDEEPGGGRAPQRQLGGTSVISALNGRAHQLASKLLAALATEPEGVLGCLERANHWGGFDGFRDRLEDHRFSRAVAWRLTLALCRRGLITSEPNRPYLDHRSLKVAQRLLEGTGLGARSVRDWEMALMLESDCRSSSTGRPARLEAELVTVACTELAARTNGR